MKKWTYLVAAGMLLGATPVFTGCIDNDEPEGISLLRGAKAELLKAKASVEAAEALRVQAEAAFLQAQAETEKAVAEFKRAEAEYKKAEAAVKLAEAAYIDAQTEEQKAKAAEALAKAEKMKQQYDLEIKELVAKTEANITWYKSKQAEYEAQYQAALKDIEIAKASLTQEQLDKLAHYNKNVKDAKDKVEAADQEYGDAVNALKEAMTNYNNEVDDLEKKNELADAVTDAERAVAVAKQNLEEAKEIAALPIEATEWQTKLDELKAQEDALAKEAAKLQVQLGEWKTAHKGEHEAVIEAMTKAGEYTGENNINVAYDDDHALPYSAFEYKVQNPGALGSNRAIEFSFEEDSYYYKDYLNSIEQDNQYAKPLAKLQWFDDQTTRVESMLKDRNGIEWTKVNLNDLKLDKKNQEDAYQKAYTAWEQAVKAFNTVDGIADPTQLAQAVKVTDAVKAYNAKAAIYKTKSDAVTAAEAAAATAATALTTATDNVTKAKKAQADYTGTDAIEIGKLAQAVRDAEAAETIAKGNKATADAAVTTAKAAQTTAWDGDATGKGGAVEAYTNLETAYNEYMNYLNIGGTLSGWNIATTAYGKKAEVAAADINKVVVVEKSTLRALVNSTSQALYGNFGSESRLVKVEESEIVDLISNSIEEYRKQNYYNQWVENGNRNYHSVSYEYNSTNSGDWGYSIEGSWLEGDKFQAEYYMDGIKILRREEQLINGQYSSSTSVVRTISFGKFGVYCQYNKDVAHATAIVENNGTEVKTIVAALKAGKENLEKEIAANNKIVEDLVANFETLKDALEKAYEESGLENAIAENQEKINILRPTKHEIQNALTVYLSKQPGYKNETSVKELQEALETAVYNAEKTLKDKQVALELAQRNVERYAQGTYNEVEAAQEDLKLKEQALKDAQAELAAANAALKAIIEKLTAQAE